LTGWGTCGGGNSGSGGEVIPLGNTQVPGDTAVTDPVKLIHNNVALVPAGATTTIISFVVPPIPIIHLLTVRFGGCNIGKYELFFGNDIQEEHVCWWTTGMNGLWDYRKGVGGGLSVGPNVIVTVKVTHNRPFPSDHFTSIYYMEVN